MNKDLIEILNNLNSIYSGAFSNLITITVAIIAFVGVAIPIAITYYQNRQLKIEAEHLENKIDHKLIRVRDELERLINEKVSSEILSQTNLVKAELLTLKEEVKKHRNLALASAMHVQGNFSLDKGSMPAGIHSMQVAAHAYLKCGDEMNLRRAINVLMSAYDKADDSIFDPLFEIAESFNKLTEALTEENTNGKYSDSIRELKAKHILCKNRSPGSAA
jgi:hypothetical protein